MTSLSEAYSPELTFARTMSAMSAMSAISCGKVTLSCFVVLTTSDE